MTADHALCGWRLRSAIPLPELMAWGGDDRAPDIEITVGSIPHSHQTDTIVDTPDVMLCAGADGMATLEIRGLARFGVADGRRVTVEAAKPADEPDIRLYLLGSVLAMLSYQRGRLPLHASCLALGDGAVAVAGDSGTGKSTLAATLARRGAAVLADDVCVVDTVRSGTPLAWPTVSRIKLWRDALDRLGIPAAGMERVRHGIEKYVCRGGAVFRTAPLPLTALYHLTREKDTPCEPPHALAGTTAVRALYRSLYRPYIARAMGREDEVAAGLMKLLATVPFFSVSHGPGPWEASPLPDVLLEHQAAVQMTASRTMYLDQPVLGELAQ